jgi:phosphoribosylformylglycinamidine synthase PurS subunit|tara:strand:- start:1372 stop:1608 length:237 start_codon:yes stop_codon:yes gene_type:complete
MRYKAMICIRRGILDNAGQTVTYALQSLGWPEVQDVRIDKVIEFDLEESDWKKAEAIAKSQTNEVMEYYKLEEINEKT